MLALLSYSSVVHNDYEGYRFSILLLLRGSFNENRTPCLTKLA